MINLEAFLKSWYRGPNEDRFKIANPNQQIINPTDVPTSVIDDMIARNPRPFFVERLDLTVAETAGRVFLIPGFHAVIYGHNDTTNRAVNTTAFVAFHAGRNSNLEDKGFPMKHARGLTAPFQAFTLRWPAQPGVYADLVIHQGMYQQWVDGESCT